MNASQLQHIIQNPESIDAQTALELQAIATDWPWFSTPRTLLARYYKFKNDYRETDSLHHAALRIQDRRWLFHYLNETPTAPGENAAAEFRQASPEPKPLSSQPITTEETQAGETNSKPHFEPVESSQQDNTEIPSESNLSLSDDNKARIEAAVKSASSFAPAEPEPTLSLEQSQPSYDLEEHFESETPSPEPQDFFAWLKQAQKEEAIELKQDTHPPLPSTVVQEQEPSIPESDNQNPDSTEVPDYNLDHLTLQKDTQPEEPKFLDLAARQALIDKFISTNPSISRPKKEFYNPEAAMKRAEEFDASVCSETLAGLFRKQQAWDKALACYSRLQLKFPEKSAYFAALITEVENEKRNHES